MNLWLLGAALVVVLGLAACTASAQTAASAQAASSTRTLAYDTVQARYADAASRFALLDGVRVHYKDEGRGPALLLVHGSFGDLADWDGWAERLTPQFRVVRLDLPGFGLTGPIANGNYSIERLLGLVDGLMDSLGVERFAIAGVSYGGLVAFRYAATRTGRVSALVLANSAGMQPGQRGAAATEGYNILTDPVVRTSDVETFLRFLLNDPALVTPARVQRKLDFANIAGRREEALAALRLYERGSPERVLANVRAPSLVLWGGANQALSTETAGAFVAALTGASARQQIVYPTGGHLLQVQQAEATANDVKTFLQTHLLDKKAP